MSTLGKKFTITTFWESHWKANWCVICGCPAWIKLTQEEITKYLLKVDVPDKDIWTKRVEENECEILSWIYNDETLWTPIMILIRNKNFKPDDYKNFSWIIRPWHAEYTYLKKYWIFAPSWWWRASWRECISRLAWGYIARKILKKYWIKFQSEVVELAWEDDYQKWVKKVLDKSLNNWESTWWIVKLTITWVPAWLGNPVFDKFSSKIYSVIWSIWAIKWIEIWAWFDISKMTWSESNDEYEIINWEIVFKSNNCWWILGWITTWEDIVIKMAVKPTPSIEKFQDTVNILSKENTKIEIKGRHDKNITPRIWPIAEAMTALLILDEMLMEWMVKTSFVKKW